MNVEYKITKKENGYLLTTNTIYLNKDFIYPTQLSAEISALLVTHCSVEVLHNIFANSDFFDDYEQIISFIKDLQHDVHHCLDDDDLALLYNTTINELNKFIDIYFEKYKNIAY